MFFYSSHARKLQKVDDVMFHPRFSSRLRRNLSCLSFKISDIWLDICVCMCEWECECVCARMCVRVQPFLFYCSFYLFASFLNIRWLYVFCLTEARYTVCYFLFLLLPIVVIICTQCRGVFVAFHMYVTHSDCIGSICWIGNCTYLRTACFLCLPIATWRSRGPCWFCGTCLIVLYLDTETFDILLWFYKISYR